MVRWSKAPRCWDEFKCNIWVNSWFRPPTECLEERDFVVFFSSPSKRKDVVKRWWPRQPLFQRGGLVFWWMELFIWIFPFSGTKSPTSNLTTFLEQATLNRSTPPRNGWSEAPEGSEKSCYFATFSPAASSCAPAMVRVFGDCAANTRPVLTKGLFSSAAWVTMKWEPYLGSTWWGRESMKGKDKATPRKRLGLNEHDGLQLCRCPCKGIIVKSWWYHCLFKLGCHFSTGEKRRKQQFHPGPKFHTYYVYRSKTG